MVRVAALAGRQHGVLSRSQLISLGLSSSAISRSVVAGRLHRLHPGVYAVGHGAIALRGSLIAALLFAGRGAALSHTTAARLWWLVDVEPKQIHVTVPGKRRSLAAVRVHRCSRPEVGRHRGLPVTTVARTLLDIAPMLTPSQLRRALAEADYRRLLDRREIETVLGRGRAGSTALRRALAAHLPALARTLSVLEERFLALCEESGVPTPEVNAKVEGLMVDAVWRRERVAVELDGYAAHGGRAAIERDRTRELALRAGGFIVVRYTWRQVTEEPARVVGDLRAALAARGRQD